MTGDFSGNLSRTSGFESGYREPIYAYLTENASDNTQMVASYESEGIKTAELYDRTKLDEPDAYEVFLGGDYDKIDIRTTADSTDRLLFNSILQGDHRGRCRLLSEACVGSVR